ncbi:MAG: hypothetical protein WBI00_03205, partial [Thermoanaerobaculia bacterium]
MTSRRFFTLLGFPAAAIVMLALVTSPVAGAENGWRLRVNGYWVDPDGRSTEVESDGVRILTDASSSFGFGVAAE